MGLKWLKDSPKVIRGMSFGHPWHKGELAVAEVAEKDFYLGETPLQTKVMAYWPDGSVKWTGHSGVVSSETELNFHQGEQLEQQAIANEKYNGIYFDNGIIKGFFPKHGEGINLLDWVQVSGEKRLTNLHLLLQYQGKKYRSQVTGLKLEENGGEKAVIKVTGEIHIQGQCAQEFTLRFRIYRGLAKLEIIHTVVIIKGLAYEGLGLEFTTALTGEKWNRQVKFVGDDVYSEPAQLLLSRRFYENNPNYHLQAQGGIVKLDAEDEPMLLHGKENAIWNNFRVVQSTHRSFEMAKQTGKDYCWLPMGDGAHYSGTLYAGGETGGVACSLENFWEKAPSEIKVSGLSHDQTKLTTWLWSPEAEAMDFRHYSERDHMLSGYEGMEEIRSTPVGIANTSRIWIDLFSTPASNEELLALAEENQQPAQIVANPEDYRNTGVFGYFSLPDKSNQTKTMLEEQMLALRQFYLAEVGQRSWYGFWNFGDVMHTYDRFRHQWRYDLGGYAWQNTELVPNMWLWLDFLRTGDAEVYYFAENMTRHTSEVDQYHAGEYKGLGSRHNVLHWGCQAKEVRISMAGLHRYYYYLTGDERIGEIMEQVKDNEEYAFDELPPMREFMERDGQKIPVRVGPDWSALVSNWFTQWERTGDQVYLQKILTGIDCLKRSPNRLLSGPITMFDPEKKTLDYLGTGLTGGYHMVISFGAPQVWTELAMNLEDDEWSDMVAEFGWMYSLSPEDKEHYSEGLLKEPNFSWPMFATTMMAYGAVQRNDQKISQRAWDLLLQNDLSGMALPVADSRQAVATWQKVSEMPWISTNVVSQWCLNVICCLDLIGDEMKEEN